MIFSSIAIATEDDEDPYVGEVLTVEGAALSPTCGGRTGRTCSSGSSTGTSSNSGDTRGSDQNGGGGTNIEGFGGTSPEKAEDTMGQAECSDEPRMRRIGASEVVRANIVFQCAANAMAHVGYWRVKFEGNTSGIYRGMNNSCRDTVLLEEITPPDCY